VLGAPSGTNWLFTPASLDPRSAATLAGL